MSETKMTMDPETVINSLWTQAVDAGFKRVLIDEGRHSEGHKVNIGYGSGAVRVKFRPTEDTEAYTFEVNLYADQAKIDQQMNLIRDEFAMVKGTY